MFNIPLDDSSASTKDTDSTNFHPFDAVLTVLQLPCTAHKINLMLQYACDNVREAEGIVDVIQAVVRQLKGCNRSKRNVILERADADAR